MLLEWDENKRLANIRKHGADFIDVAAAFDGRPSFTYFSPRNDEDRWGTVVEITDILLVIVWTEREEGKRIISAYRADDWEIGAYKALYG